MDVYEKALRNPDPPKKPRTLSKLALIDNQQQKVSFIPGVPSISQLRQEPRLLHPIQSLPAPVQLQQLPPNAAIPFYPTQQQQQQTLLPQQQFAPQVIPAQFSQQQQQPLIQIQGSSVPQEHGQTPSNSSVTNIHENSSPVLSGQQQQQQQRHEQQEAQLKFDLSLSKRKRNSRRKHRNSHLGCGTCKKRRIKCDETLPSCLNCLKGKLHCAYLNLDSNARNALRLAQYNQSMRQERLEGGKGDDYQEQQQQQQQQQQQIQGAPQLVQQQTQHGTILTTVGNAQGPTGTMMTNGGSFIPMQQPQQMGQPTAVMQSQYGPISLVPVLTNTGAVVYAPASAIPGAGPGPGPGPGPVPVQVPVSQQPTPAPQMAIMANTPQQQLSQPSVPLQQQQTPNTMRERASSTLSTSSALQDTSSRTISSMSPSQGQQQQQQQHQQLPSLTPIISTAANAATLASQSIHMRTQKEQQQQQQSANVEIKLPSIAPISVPSINVSKSQSTSVSPSLKSDSEAAQTPKAVPALSPISMSNAGSKEDGLTPKNNKSSALPSISQITQQPSTSATPTSPDLEHQETQKEEQKAEEQRREERTRAYSRSEANTSSHSRSRSRSPTRSSLSRTASPQSTTLDTTTTHDKSTSIASKIAKSSHLASNLVSVSNFDSLSLKEKNEAANGIKMKSPTESKEEKVSISKLIT